VNLTDINLNYESQRPTVSKAVPRRQRKLCAAQTNDKQCAIKLDFSRPLQANKPRKGQLFRLEEAAWVSTKQGPKV
jgi:hypothetical protein